jgi:ACS family tartrate transporter-like MFS transporter
MDRTIEQQTMRKVYWRILPFTGLLYFICYIDRVNVGFAALTMPQDLGPSQAAFGVGAGTAFFLGYFLLEVPSNVVLHKIGARLWFPPVHRGRITAGFMTAIPISIALGGPISTSLLELQGFLGLAGWQWLYLIEAGPAVLLGIVCLIFLTDRPEKAHWLRPEERAWLTAELQKERREVESVRSFTELWPEVGDGLTR